MKQLLILIVILVFTKVLFAQDEDQHPPQTSWAIGFFSKANDDGTITILASYKAWKCEVPDRKQAAGIMPGSLFEFEFWMKGDIVVIVKLVDHGFPTKEEFERIVGKYRKQRMESWEGKKLNEVG